MKREEVAKIELGYIIRARRRNEESLFLTLGNNGEKAICLETCKGENFEENASISVEVNGKKTSFNLKKKVAIAGKDIMGIEDFLPKGQKEILRSLLPKEKEKGEVLKKGDIIQYLDQTFVIVSIEKEAYICYVYDTKKEKIGVQYQIPKKSKIKKVGARQGTEEILPKKTGTKNNIIEEGTLVTRSGELYYIYEANATYYKAVKIDFVNEYTLAVRNFSYPSSLMEEIEIPKDSKNCKVQTIAFVEEIKENKNLLRNKKSKNIVEEKFLEPLSSIPKERDLVQLASGEIYIVLLEKDNFLLCIDFNKYMIGKWYMEEISEKKLFVVGRIKEEAYREILENLSECYSIKEN